MEKCLNVKCPYHKKGKCELYPGDQWRVCKRSSAPAVKRTAKGKGRIK